LIAIDQVEAVAASCLSLVGNWAEPKLLQYKLSQMGPRIHIFSGLWMSN
jgi:hypothetical protein